MEQVALNGGQSGSECVEYSGINKLRELTNSEDCKFVIWCGNKRLIKKNMFCEYLDKQYSI